MDFTDFFRTFQDTAVADKQYSGHCFHIPLPLYFALRAARFQQLFFPKDIQRGEKLHAHAVPAGGKTHFKGMGRIQAAALQHQQVPAHTRRRSGDIGLVYHIFRVFSSAVRVFGAGYKRKAAHGAANTEPWTAKR